MFRAHAPLTRSLSLLPPALDGLICLFIRNMSPHRFQLVALGQTKSFERSLMIERIYARDGSLSIARYDYKFTFREKYNATKL